MPPVALSPLQIGHASLYTQLVTLYRRSAIASLAILALIVAATWFRIRGTLIEPLWLDEAYSAYAASKGFHFLWNVVPLYETHPPFYYSLLRVWTLGFGDSLTALRALGIVCGLLTLPVAVLALREVVRDKRPAGVAIIAALALVSLSPPLVEMSREVRPYPVLILVYSIATAMLLRLGRIAAAEHRIARAPFIIYLICQALMLWLHNLGPLYAAALGLAFLVLVARPGLARADWIWFFVGHALVALVYLPGLWILLDQAPTWVRSTWLRFNPGLLGARLQFLYAAGGWPAAIAAAALLVLAAMTLWRDSQGRRVLIGLLLLALLPTAASILISMTIAPVFIVRTLTATALPMLLLFAIGIGLNFGRERAIGLGALLILLTIMAIGDYRERERGPMQDWYAALKWLGERYRPGDVVWAYPNEGALPFDYAVRDLGMKVVTRPIPTAIPTLDGGPGAWNPTGSRGVVSLPADRLKTLADAPEARAVPTIWLLRLGANAYDKGDHLLHALEANRVRVADCETYPIDVIGLARPDVAGTPPTFPAKRAPCVPGK
ncbi:hypothetical protein ACFB49_38020 [Sphingomonas sp. DBB INV C78]